MGYAQTNPFGYYLSFGGKIGDVALSHTPGGSYSMGSFNLPVELRGRVASAYIDFHCSCIEDSSGATNQTTNVFNAYLYQGAIGHACMHIVTGTFNVKANAQRSGDYWYGNTDVHAYLNFGADQYTFFEYPECTADYIYLRDAQIVVRMWVI